MTRTRIARVAGGRLKVQVVESGLPLAYPGTWQVNQYEVNLELRGIGIKAQPTDQEGVHYATQRIFFLQSEQGMTGSDLDVAIENFRLTRNGPNYMALIDMVRQSYQLQEEWPDLDVAAIALSIPVWEPMKIFITEGVPMPAWAVAEAQDENLWPGGFATTTVGKVIHHHFPSIPAADWHPYAAHLSGATRPEQLPDLPLSTGRTGQLLGSIVPALLTIEQLS